MKKLVLFALLAFVCSTAIYAQKTVKESDVPQRYVKDFQNKQKDATSVVWCAIDSTTFSATFQSDGEKQAMIFSPKGTETRYYVDSRYYPQSIKDTVAHQYKGYKLSDLYVRSAKNKTSYQARVAKRCGFLFWKHDCDVQLLNFEATGKFIDAQPE